MRTTIHNTPENSMKLEVFESIPRYGFNTMEKDDEIMGGGNTYTTFFRLNDPRLGRWLTVDPKINELSWQSSYVSMDNNPVIFTDVKGDNVKAGKGSNDAPVDPGNTFNGTKTESKIVNDQVVVANTDEYNKYLEEKKAFDEYTATLADNTAKASDRVAAINATLTNFQVAFNPVTGNIDPVGKVKKKDVKGNAYDKSVLKAINSKETLDLTAPTEGSNLIEVKNSTASLMSMNTKDFDRLLTFGNRGVGLARSQLAYAFTAFNEKSDLKAKQAEINEIMSAFSWSPSYYFPLTAGGTNKEVDNDKVIFRDNTQGVDNLGVIFQYDLKTGEFKRYKVD